MDLNQDDILPLQDLYFNETYTLYHTQYNHFNQCLEETIPSSLIENPNKFYESVSGNKIYTYRFLFEDISIKPPVIPGKDEYMFPEDARRNNYTYAARIEATVKQIQEITDVNTNEKEIKIIGEVEREHPIAYIPIMIRSNYCNINIRKDIKNNECKFDPGCYFIVKGNEKVVIGMERMIDNKILTFKKKDSSYKGGFKFFSTVNSKKKKNYTDMTQTLNVRIKKDKTIIIETPHFSDVPLVVMLRALGINSDKEIVDYITNNKNDTLMNNILRYSIKDNIIPDFKIDNEVMEIKNQEYAILSLMNKIKKYRKLSDTNDDDRLEQQKIYVLKILKNDVLPHLGEELINKAYYICLMVKKLLNVYLGRKDPDDRDSYVNKRVDMPGTLITQLFKQYYKKMLNDIKKFFEKKYNGDDENPINVINQIKPNTIQQGLINGLSTGIWGIQKARKGVSQALQRYSFMQSIAYYRRIVTPSVDSSTQKVVSIRHARNNQYGFIDTVETPEGQKVGLQKHLSIMADITLKMKSQTNIIMDLIFDKIISLSEVDPYDFSVKYKVFLNGNWIGFVDEPDEFVNFIRGKRSDNFLNRHVSIINNIYDKEIKIYTDGGRMVRPLLKIKDNKLLLTKKMLDSIDLSGTDNTKISRWNLFLLKYPKVIEYVDIEESENLMISMKVKD